MFLLAAAGVTVWVLVNNGDELVAAVDNLGRVDAGWLVLAMALEVVSYVAYAAGEQVLLREVDAAVGLVPLTELTVAAQAAAYCIPGGVAVTGVVTYRVLRRFRVEPGPTVAVLFVLSVLYIAALAVLALAAAPLAGSQNVLPELAPISYGVLGVGALLAGVAWLLRRRGLLARAGRRVGPAMEAFARRAGVEADDSSGPWSAHISGLTFRPSAVLASGLLMVVCWLGDALCLALCFYAVGSSPPWEGLLLIYAAAQLAATLPITPGGLGVIEGSLTVGLVAFGGAEAATLSAVLLYRLISFWGLLPTGGLAYLRVRRGLRRAAALEAG
ncbi:MAG: putative heme transporter [Solirubrobacteraceae bacterium]|nr:putative heme transporter [Solirubrobacteraceae bacterium]